MDCKPCDFKVPVGTSAYLHLLPMPLVDRVGIPQIPSNVYLPYTVSYACGSTVSQFVRFVVNVAAIPEHY